MAQYLVVLDFRTVRFTLHAGKVIDDAQYDVTNLVASGLVVLPYTAAIEVALQLYLRTRGRKQAGSSGLFELLFVRGLLGPGQAGHVLVEDIGDLPVPVGGEHVLAENAVYQFNGMIDSAASLRLPSSSLLVGTSPGRDGFNYTGVGTALICPAGAGFPGMKNMALFAANGTALDVQGTANFLLIETVVQAKHIGNVAVTVGSFYDVTRFLGFETGLTFTGTIGRMSMDFSTFIQSVGGVGNACVDLSDGVFESILMSKVRLNAAAGGVGLAGLAGSGNIATGGSGKLTGSVLNGDGVPLFGVHQDDLQWEFDDVSGIADSLELGDIAIEPVSTTKTEITAQGAPGDAVGWVKVAGTTVANFERRWEMTGDNELTYRDDETKVQSVVATATTKMETGGLAALQVGVFVNGTLLNSVVAANPSSTIRDTPTLHLVREFETDDVIDLRVRNLSSTVDVVVESMHLTVQS